jgi:hypothetical protein
MRKLAQKLLSICNYYIIRQYCALQQPIGFIEKYARLLIDQKKYIYNGKTLLYKSIL